MIRIRRAKPFGWHIYRGERRVWVEFVNPFLEKWAFRCSWTKEKYMPGIFTNTLLLFGLFVTWCSRVGTGGRVSPIAWPDAPQTRLKTDDGQFTAGRN